MLRSNLVWEFGYIRAQFTVYSRKFGEKPCINKIPTFKKLRKAVFLKLEEIAFLHNPASSDKVWSPQRRMLKLENHQI